MYVVCIVFFWGGGLMLFCFFFFWGGEGCLYSCFVFFGGRSGMRVFICFLFVVWFGGVVEGGWLVN